MRGIFFRFLGYYSELAKLFGTSHFSGELQSLQGQITKTNVKFLLYFKKGLYSVTAKRNQVLFSQLLENRYEA